MGAWMRRLTSESTEADAEDLSSDVAADTAACAAGDCHQGQKVMLLGRLRCVDLNPSSGVPSLTAELYDGTDAVQLVWLGRRSIRGIEPGRTLRARGRVLVKAGHKTMYNPEYELMPLA